MGSGYPFLLLHLSQSAREEDHVCRSVRICCSAGAAASALAQPSAAPAACLWGPGGRGTSADPEVALRCSTSVLRPAATGRLQSFLCLPRTIFLTLHKHLLYAAGPHLRLPRPLLPPPSGLLAQFSPPSPRLLPSP